MPANKCSSHLFIIQSLPRLPTHSTSGFSHYAEIFHQRCQVTARTPVSAHHPALYVLNVAHSAHLGLVWLGNGMLGRGLSGSSGQQPAGWKNGRMHKLSALTRSYFLLPSLLSLTVFELMRKGWVENMSFSSIIQGSSAPFPPSPPHCPPASPSWLPSSRSRLFVPSRTSTFFSY